MFLSKFFHAFATTLCVTVFMIASAFARTPAEISKSGYVLIGVYDENASLLGHRDDAGVWHGYDEYLAARLAKDLGVELRLVPISAQERISATKTGKVDIMLGNFSHTKERAQEVDFSLPYMKAYLGLVSRGGAIDDPEKIHNKKIAAPSGTAALDYLWSEYYASVTIVEKPDYLSTFKVLIDGEVDGVLIDNTEAVAWARSHPGFGVGLPKIGNPDPVAPAVRKGEFELLKWLDAEMETLGAELFFHADYEKTLKPVFGDVLKADDVVIDGKCDFCDFSK